MEWECAYTYQRSSRIAKKVIIERSDVLFQVNVIRSLKEDEIMVGALSHSTTLGKMLKELLDVPQDPCVNFPRYNLDETSTVYIRMHINILCQSSTKILS